MGFFKKIKSMLWGASEPVSAPTLANTNHLPVRAHERSFDAMRPIQFQRHFTKHAEGSVLVSYGDTKVLCTASIEDKVPGFLRGQGTGWLTAEYSMLPRSTHTRSDREASKGKQSGRTQEIQRLIGRSLRAAIDLTALGERTITIDCDVLQADGGTRTASISGAYVALVDAIQTLIDAQKLTTSPLRFPVAAVSVGICNGVAMLDLDYEEDSQCSTDMNIVMNSELAFIEMQGTAEENPFTSRELIEMLDLAQLGIEQIFAAQTLALNPSADSTTPTLETH